MIDKQTYHIRFNTNSTSDVDRWRLVCDGKETLHSDIVINTQTYTTKDYIDGVGDKWHITCYGYLTIKDNVAYIDNKINEQEIDYIRQKLEEGEQSGFVKDFNPNEHSKNLKNMEVNVLESSKIFYSETNEYLLRIGGEQHSFRVFDSSDEEPQYWFDGEEYYDTSDEVIDGLTIQDLLDSI